MRYSLPSGKVVNIPLAFFLQMDDLEFNEEIMDLIIHDFGVESDDIWQDSVLTCGEKTKGKKSDTDDDDEILPFLFDDDFTEPFDD